MSQLERTEIVCTCGAADGLMPPHLQGWVAVGQMFMEKIIAKKLGLEYQVVHAEDCAIAVAARGE